MSSVAIIMHVMFILKYIISMLVMTAKIAINIINKCINIAIMTRAIRVIVCIMFAFIKGVAIAISNSVIVVVMCCISTVMNNGIIIVSSNDITSVIINGNIIVIVNCSSNCY